FCITRVAFVLVGVELGCHVSAASPGFISHTPVLDTPGFGAAIARAEFSHRAKSIEIEVFHPFAHFFYSTTSHVTTYIRFSPQQRAQLQKLVRSKAVIFHYISPIGINHFRSLRTITNTVAPMVFISETPTGPAQVGNFYFLQ